jgi:hypothetical protein
MRRYENAVYIYCLLLAYDLELSIIGAAWQFSSQQDENCKKRSLVADSPLHIMTGRNRSPSLSNQDFATVPRAPVHPIKISAILLHSRSALNYTSTP